MLTNAYERERTGLSQKELNGVLAAHERFTVYQSGSRAILTGRRLDGLNLANRILSDADFSGSSFIEATLYGSNLQRASLYCADLRGANLQAANLTRADMRGASFKGANLSYATLDGADMRAARMMVVGPDGMSVVDHTRSSRERADLNKLFDGVDFSNCSMKHASLGNAKFENADFSGAILEGAKFKGSQLKNPKFKGAILTGVDLKELGVPAEALEGCVLDVTPAALEKSEELKARLAMHEQWIATEGASGGPALLDGEDLRPLQDMPGRRLVGLSARKIIGVGVDFSGCQLQVAKFDDADLRGADFSHCDLRGASFRGANLSHVNFTAARLGNLKLAQSEKMTDLTGAVLSAHQLQTARVECPIPDLGFD